MKTQLYEKVVNWKAVREVVVEELTRKKIKYRGDMPVGYLQNVWHNRKGNKNVKNILIELIGKSPEDK